jgi:hypothetical protein
MAISFVGANIAAGTNISVSLPAGAATGDLILYFVYRVTSALSPSLPTGYTAILNSGAVTPGVRACYRVMQSGDTATGASTNGERGLVIVLRGQNASTPIGASTQTNGTSTTVSIPALTLSVTDGTSWVVGSSMANSGDERAASPANLTNRTSGVGSGSSPLPFGGTGEGVSSWSATTHTITSAAWRGVSVEVEAATPITGTFTADAVFKRNQTGSFTADAIIKRNQTGSYTGNAIVKRAISGSFTADGDIKRTISSSFTEDGVIKAGEAGSFTADAFLQQGLVISSFTADGITSISSSSSGSADAVLRKTSSPTFSADAALARSISSSFSANAVLRSQVLFGLTANAVLHANLYTFSADAIVGTATAQRWRHHRLRDHFGFESDENVALSAPLGPFPAGTPIHDVVDDLISRLTALESGNHYVFSFTGNGYILAPGTVVETSPGTWRGAFFMSAALKKNMTGSFTANAVITRGGRFTANAVIQGPRSFVAYAVII